MTTIYLKSDSLETLLDDLSILGIKTAITHRFVTLPFGLLEVIGSIVMPLSETEIAANLKAQQAGAPLPHLPQRYEGYHANIYCTSADMPDWSCMLHTTCVSPKQPYRKTY